MSIGWIVINIALNFYDAAFFTLNLNDHVASRSFNKSYFKYIAILIIAILFNIINFSTDFSLMSLYVFPMIVVIYLSIFHGGSWYYKAFWMIFLFMILTSCDIIGTFLVASVIKISASVTFENNAIQLLTLLVCRIMSTSAWMYLHKKREDIQITSIKTLRLWIILCFLFSTIIIISISISNIFPEYSSFSKTILPVVIGSMFLTLLMFFIITNVREKLLNKQIVEKEMSFEQKKQAILEKENELEQRKSQILHSYQYEVVKTYKAVRKYHTEIFKQMQTVWMLNRKANKPIMEHFAVMADMAKMLKSDYESGDSLIDIVLSIKASDALIEHIALEFHGELDDTVLIPSDDICFILDCLLTEAIENASAVSDYEVTKSISVVFIKNTRKFQIKIEYPASIGDQMKNDAIDHIHQVISRHNGVITFVKEEGYCELLVNFIYPDFIDQNISLAKGG